MLAAAVHACLSGVLVMPASQAAGVLVCGWLLGLLPNDAPARIANLSATILLRSGLVMSLALFAFALHEITVSDLMLEQTQMLDRGIPRFWQNGKVCRIYRETGHN